MDSIVALDIETTGLDAEKDAIIEIGAVRFNGTRIEDEWSTLINPGRRIPPFITQLTGISDAMVVKAPAIRTVIGELTEFVGNQPILGHNIRFDLSFLQRQGILKTNPILDTYELASILLPGAGRYNLGALGQALGVLLPATHRALDDAQTTRGVFLRLYDEAMRMPISLLAEILQLSDNLDWGGSLPLRWVMRARSREIVTAESLIQVHGGQLFSKRGFRPQAPLQPNESPQPLQTEEVAAILEQGGIFSHHFSGYEFRPQQVEMLRAISDALSQGRHLMVEAGTGVGKSMAYLIPAALWAMQNNQRVVVSTNTINLQDQLINKDIPDLREALSLDLRAVVLKGRGNYLCPRRFESLRHRGPENVDELRILAKILIWLQGTQTGDRNELNLNGPVERQIWSRISADDENCTTENCLKQGGGVCPFYRVRQAAQSAHLLVVNHALLLSDIATGSRVLPEYTHLIVDEAHHMEAATTNALSYRITHQDIERMLRELGGPRSGLLGWLLTATQGILQPSEYAVLDQIVNQVVDLAVRFQSQVREFFASLNHFLTEQREGRPVGMYSQQERILPATRAQPAWGEVEMAWDDADHSLKAIVDILTQIMQGLGEINHALSDEDNELFGSFSNLFRRFYELNTNIENLVFTPQNDRVYWVEAQVNGYNLALNAAPLHIGELMDKHLWREKTSMILTSATLTTAGEFDYLRGRLGAEMADELALGSPFDYENAALLYLVNDIPEPSDRQGHQRAVEQGLIQLCKATGGRALVLFTSYDQLKRTSQAIAPALSREDIVIYEQGEGASASNLLETFRTSQRAVLLGTRSFWEGVDVSGDALSVLVIVKLPFDVPSDPLVAARSETFEDPFNQYSLPEAILRFRQGFGRLIRSQSDRGIVAILDRRILSKRYGRLFIDSLPQCTVQIGSLAGLAPTAARWLNL